MAQSKKDQLKRLRRQYAQVGRTLATAPCDILMLDFYKQLDVDIRATRQQMQGGYAGDLQYVPSPATFQHLDHLHRRVTALQRRLDPGCYDDDLSSASML